MYVHKADKGEKPFFLCLRGGLGRFAPFVSDQQDLYSGMFNDLLNTCVFAPRIEVST